MGINKNYIVGILDDRSTIFNKDYGDQFKELTEFDACFLIYRAPISFNLKDMLRDYMKFREFECAKYDEILKRASVIKGSSFPKNSKAYAVNKKK